MIKFKLKQILSRLVFTPLIIVNEFIDRMMGFSLLSKVVSKGEFCVFEGYGRIYEIDRLKLGSHIFLGRNFFLRSAGGISIGDFTHISRNVTIHTVNHNISGNLLPYDETNIVKPISIGKYVWIGMNVSILPGVSIGDGAVIGMGTVVSKNVAAGEIVVGSVQRVVGKRDEVHTRNLVENHKYLKKHI